MRRLWLTIRLLASIVLECFRHPFSESTIPVNQEEPEVLFESTALDTEWQLGSEWKERLTQRAIEIAREQGSRRRGSVLVKPEHYHAAKSEVR